MKGSVLILWLSALALSASAQYYYTDILNTASNQKNFSTLQKEKIKKVTVKAYDTEGEMIEDFILYQEIDASKRILTTFSKTGLTDASILQTTYNGTYKPILVVDSSESATTKTRYVYDTRGLLVSMQSQSVQSEQKENVVAEERKYAYNESGIPDSMLRIKGVTDTMVVKFIPSENGLPGEEQWFKAGVKTETWFYYYDAAKRLTDIVRYNAAAKQMLPDYLFSFDEAGNMTSRVTVMPDTNQFRIWQFSYTERGLKSEERVMNRQRRQEGKLVYEYQ